ncbi:MAG: FHA domain-containing protein [Anaerolineae bacterium]
MIQGGDSFRLVVRRGPQPNQTYELNKDIITLGRDITNDIVINDPEVSRHHMRMTRGPGGYTIEDLGSTNGTFVNGQRVTGARPLRNGDMIGLGETVTLGYELVSAATAPPPGAGVTAPNVPQTGFSAVPSAPAASQPMGAAPEQPAAQPYGTYSSGYNSAPAAYGSQAPANQQPGQYGTYNGGYNQPGAPAYGNQQPYSAAPSPAAPPMGGEYGDYDPIKVRDEGQSNNTRWILIGCAGLGLFCCCSSVLGLVIIDAARLWDSIPVFSQTITPILRTIGTALGLL